MKCKIENLKFRIGSLWNFYVWQFLIPLFSLLILCGCNHREFEYESSQTAYLDVVFDWVNDPTANPGSMSLYLFPDEGGIPYRYDFGGRDGGTIRLRPGIYHAVCINSDERDISFRGEESHTTFEIYMSEATTMAFGNTYSVRSLDLPRAEGLEEQPLVQTPPLLWSTFEGNFKVEVQSSLARTENPKLIMQPKRIVDTYVVTVKNIKNIQYLRALSASLSDMADGYLAGVMTHNNNAVTLPLELSHNTRSATAEGQFYTFGHCSEPTQRTHKLMLYAIMSDGKKYYFEHDVTVQAHNPPDENNIYHIVIDGLDLPEPTGGGDSGGGFNPEVNDWNTIHINLPM